MTSDMQDTPLPAGRIMALDLGEKRIGVALSDATQTLARSYEVVPRTSRQADFARFAEIVAAEDVRGLLVGLPTELDGSESEMAAWVRDYAADLAATLNLPYRLWDESFTTRQAAASLRERGRSARQQRDWIDAVAAAFLLQSYLDRHYDTPA